MLTYLKIFLYSIKNIYFQESKDESKITYNPEKLKVFIGENQRYIFISDENHLDVYKDENGSYRLKNIKFYFIESKEQRDDAGFKNFLSDLQSSAKIDWRNYKNEISIKWSISNEFHYAGIAEWATVHPIPIQYSIVFVSDFIAVFLNQKYGFRVVPKKAFKVESNFCPFKNL